MFDLLAVATGARLLAHLRLPGSPLDAALLRGAILVAAMLVFNWIGLAFTGMEHSLQLWLTLLALYGVVRVVEGGALPVWLPLAIVAGPLVRYENLGVSGGALLVLFVSGQRRAALASALGIALTLGAFSALLLGQDLAALPSSVLTPRFS